MPKVSKESVYLGHDLGTVKMEIVFSAKFGSFTIKLPDQVKNILGKGEVSSETFDGVKNEFKMAMKAYRQALTTERKVIRYRFKAKAEFIIEEKEDGCKWFCANEVSFAEGTALDLFYLVCMERTVDNKKAYYHLNGNYISHESDKDKTMEWTAEREAFFKALTHGLEQSIMKAHNFFNANSDDIMKFIDSGGRLMLPESVDELVK
jgi:hypothetical protein